MNFVKAVRKLLIPETKHKFHFKSYTDLEQSVRKILPLVEDFDLIVGVPRSGMVPAYMIAAYLNRQVCSLPEFLSGNIGGHGFRQITENKAKHRVLVVDDSISSGAAMAKVKKQIKESGLANSFIIKYLAVYGIKESCDQVDFCAELVPHPRIFAWNYLHHPKYSELMCWDIDGVLCVDPTPDQNDDGEKYIDFILNAPLLYKPTYEIGALVTSRLEKYRPQTEQWLNANGIQYKQLIMLDLPNKEERVKAGCHASYKAEIYKKLKNMLMFVESSAIQADEIAKLSGKPVICTENIQLYEPNKTKK